MIFTQSLFTKESFCRGFRVPFVLKTQTEITAHSQVPTILGQTLWLLISFQPDEDVKGRESERGMRQNIILSFSLLALLWTSFWKHVGGFPVNIDIPVVNLCKFPLCSYSSLQGRTSIRLAIMPLLHCNVAMKKKRRETAEEEMLLASKLALWSWEWCKKNHTGWLI